MRKQKLYTAWLVLLSALIAAMVLTGCNKNPATETHSKASAEASPPVDIGEGETAFHFEVRLGDGTSSFFNVHTDEKTVGAALLDVGLIEGEHGDYGLYVNTVNGITLSYDDTQEYWAFYIDGAYASAGVDTTEIAPGVVYAFAVEK